MTSSLRCSKSYNFAPYSKLNVEMNFVNVGSTGYRKALRLIKGTESGGDQLATFETSDIRSPGTYTLSLNVSSLQLTTPFVLYISTGTMSSNTPSYIYHVWFS